MSLFDDSKVLEAFKEVDKKVTKLDERITQLEIKMKQLESEGL